MRDDDEIPNVRLIHYWCSVESLTRRLCPPVLALLVMALVACQAPAPPTPTPTPQPGPTAAPKPTAPPAVTSSRVDTVNAAGTAFKSGDLKMAAGLYERVVNTPPVPGDNALITDFADFRAMVALLADGQEEPARAHRDALQQRDANAVFSRLASQLWDQYGMVGQLRGACAQLQPQLASQATTALAALQAAGVSIDAATLCTVPQI